MPPLLILVLACCALASSAEQVQEEQLFRAKRENSLSEQDEVDATDLELASRRKRQFAYFDKEEEELIRDKRQLSYFDSEEDPQESDSRGGMEDAGKNSRKEKKKNLKAMKKAMLGK